MKKLLLILALFVGSSYADKPSANFYLDCEMEKNMFFKYGKKALVKYDERSDSLLWISYFDEGQEEREGKALWNESLFPYRRTNIDFHIFSDDRDKNGIYRSIEINRKNLSATPTTNLSAAGSIFFHECKLINKTKYQEIYNEKQKPKNKFKDKNKI